MKLEYPKEWCMRMATLEGDAAIGVGPLAVDPTFEHETAKEPDMKTWQHAANEWADAACNGLQWMRNVRDGISTPEEAVAALLSDIEHARSEQPPVMYAQDLTQQREELVGALEEIADYPELDACELKRIARAAIAKVGAGTNDGCEA